MVKTAGEFTRHAHPDTEEMFPVLSGSLTMRMPNGKVELGSGQMCVIPRDRAPSGSPISAYMAARGEIRPVIDRTYPLLEAAAAIRHLEVERARGKLVVTV